MGKHRACSKRLGAVSTGLAGAGRAVLLGFDTGHSGAGTEAVGGVLGASVGLAADSVCCGQALGLQRTQGVLWACTGLACSRLRVCCGQAFRGLQPTQGVLWASIGLAAVSGCVVGKHWACSRLRVCCGQALGLQPTRCVVGKHWACSRLRVCCGQALGLQPTQGVLWASTGLAASYRGCVVSTGLTGVNQVGVECRPRELTLGVSFGLAASYRGCVVSTGLTCVNQVGVECRHRELTLGVSFGLAACRRGGLRSG